MLYQGIVWPCCVQKPASGFESILNLGGKSPLVSNSPQTCATGIMQICKQRGSNWIKDPLPLYSKQVIFKFELVQKVQSKRRLSSTNSYSIVVALKRAFWDHQGV